MSILVVKKTSRRTAGKGITIIVIKIRIPMGKLIVDNILIPLLFFSTNQLSTHERPDQNPCESCRPKEVEKEKAVALN